jgi:prepilin-type N-terminal cleavage/methylation domain-containing protein
MKPEVILKYLSYINNKKNNKQEGFTLIELLIVIIIIGILAAVAFPVLLGQIGKARETEGKNAVGTINRAQQAYHVEKGVWTGPLNNTQLQAINILGIKIPASKYYKFTIAGASTGATSTIIAEGIEANSTNVDNGKSQGTRDYSGLIEFIPTAGQYNLILCQANTSGTVGLVPINTTSCAANHTEVK